MPIPIIREMERVEEDYYMVFFNRIPYDGGGYAFDCDADGNLLDSVTDTARQHYAECLTGHVGDEVLGPAKIQAFSRRYNIPALALCDCGHELELAAFTNTCEQCGADYSMSGQHLAPRSQWGEETGESLSDILNIGHHIS